MCIITILVTCPPAAPPGGIERIEGFVKGKLCSRPANTLSGSRSIECFNLQHAHSVTHAGVLVYNGVPLSVHRNICTVGGPIS